MNHYTILYEEWAEKFRPIVNPSTDQNIFYDWTDPQDSVILDGVIKTEPRRVWTYQDNDYGMSCITEGIHFVNRLAYVITEAPYEEGDSYGVYFDEEDRDYRGQPKCPNCGTYKREELEGEGVVYVCEDCGTRYDNQGEEVVEEGGMSA